jgi:hypothetical protein
MNKQELIIVGNRVQEWNNPRCWAFRDGYRLKMSDAIECPEYG